VGYILLGIGGIALLVTVGVLSFIAGVGAQAKEEKKAILKKWGATSEDIKIYRDAMKFISDLTSHATLNDALAPIGEQTLLSDVNKKRASDLLARHRKEHN
jgi:hypothetical protein